MPFDPISSPCGNTGEQNESPFTSEAQTIPVNIEFSYHYTDEIPQEPPEGCLALQDKFSHQNTSTSQ